MTPQDVQDLQLYDEALRSIPKDDPRWKVLAGAASTLLTRVCGYPVNIHICEECEGEGCSRCAKVGYTY